MAQLIIRKMLSLDVKYIPFAVHLSSRTFSTKGNENSDDVSKSNFRIFKDEDSPIILDMEEELTAHAKETNKRLEIVEEIKEEPLKRGVTGVFDIEELVSYLRKDNAKDIIVVKLPEALKYVDYIVIVTGKSRRHLLGLTEYIRNVYKKKMHSSDTIPRIEGKDSSDWIAMDLGNIALHVMSNTAREQYDLESLWSLGPEYDLKTIHQDDDIVELLRKHSINLDDLKPLEHTSIS